MMIFLFNMSLILIYKKLNDCISNNNVLFDEDKKAIVFEVIGSYIELYQDDIVEHPCEFWLEFTLRLFAKNEPALAKCIDIIEGKACMENENTEKTRLNIFNAIKQYLNF